jgi:DNA-binding NarL/FixJ family response regulator
MFYERLTKREKEILKLVAHGLSDKDISKMLCISYNTVRAHVVNILNTLSIDSRHSTRVARAGMCYFYWKNNTDDLNKFNFLEGK